MEQHAGGMPRAAAAPDRGDQRRLVPLVDEHEVGIADERGDVGAFAVGARRQLGIVASERRQSGLAAVAQQVVEAPGSLGLERHDVVAERLQLAQHAAQEMRVAVVPAGAQRMREGDDLHASTSAGAVARAGTP